MDRFLNRLVRREITRPNTPRRATPRVLSYRELQRKAAELGLQAFGVKRAELEAAVAAATRG